MPADLDAVRRWAAVHAASVTAVSSPIVRHDPTTPSSPAPQAIPAALAPVTETRTWRTESDACGVSVGTAPDGQLQLAVGEQSGTVRIWDPETGELLRSLTGHTEAVYSVDWGHDGDGRPLLATAGQDGTVRIWDPQTGEPRYGSPIGIAEHTRMTAGGVSWGYFADGRPLLAIGAERTWIWDPATGAEARVIGDAAGSIYTVSWITGQQEELLLAAGCADRTVRIYDAGTGRAMQVLTGHIGGVRSVAWASRADDPLMLITVGMDETSRGGVGETAIRRWRERPDGAFTMEIIDLALGPLDIAFWIPFPDGRALLACMSNDSLFIFDGSTLELLHSEPLDTSGRGLHNLGWGMAPNGSLLLCATSEPDHVHVWHITLDPPVALPVPQQPNQRGPLLIPPEDVTPPFQTVENRPTPFSVHCAVRADGQVIAATMNSHGELQIWVVSSGALLNTLALESEVNSEVSLAWGHMLDGRLLLATADLHRPDIKIWDSSTWQLVATRVHQPQSSERDGVEGIAWIHDQDGRPLLASGGSYDGTVCVQDPESGLNIRQLTGHGHYVNAIAEGRLADGRHLLVTGNHQAPARLWDLDTGEPLFEFTVPTAIPQANYMWSAAWGHGPGGQPMIAIGAKDGAVRIWDPETANLLRTLEGHAGEVYSLIWVDQPGWPSILVSGGVDRTVRIWDPDTGSELARLRGGSVRLHGIDTVRTPDGDLLLVACAVEPDDPGPLRVWRIAVGPRTSSAARSGPGEPLSTHRAVELTERLLRLGAGGLWPPLGLLADLVTLTRPAITASRAPDDAPPAATALCDARLAALSGEPGIARLRDLVAGQPGWGPAARVAFAALLASGLNIPEQYIPPADADLASLREALTDRLSTRSGVPAQTPAGTQVPVAELRKAAGAITGQTVTLLRILGPDACAADPLLPLRLAHHVHQLPVLSQHELRLLASADGQRAAAGRATAVGTLVYSPGTVGITRSGPLTRLLPTELALPRDLMTARLAEDQLLYRQHRAPTPPAPEPVTIILDTTPPTFGPAGQVLRLAAHLIATTLWEHGRYPFLITLTTPGFITPLRAPADLVSVWASITLDDPSPALAAALRTATMTGQPAVFCTHHHTARAGYVPGPATRLLTTHHPPEQPPRPLAGPWHVHLPPEPTMGQLGAAIAEILIPGLKEGA